MAMKPIPFLLLILTLSACAAQPTPEASPVENAPFVLQQEENPYAPRNEDLSLQQDSVILTSASLSERYDLTPIRSALHILASMPNVCSELRIKINPPTPQYQIIIEIYSVTNPKVNCLNVFQQVETTILLGAYSNGQYTVWINDRFVGSLAAY
jgi:hypothetical protein